MYLGMYTKSDDGTEAQGREAGICDNLRVRGN